MSNLVEKDVVKVKASEMLGADGSTDKETFIQACNEFGGVDIAHTLLMHELKLRNNLNASRFLGRMIDQDYDNAVRRAGSIMNRMQGRSAGFISWSVMNRIKAGVAQLYQTMTLSNIEMTKTSFIFPILTKEDE